MLLRFILSFISILLSGCLWISCTGSSGREHNLFTGMDSLLETNPDSAYKVLTAMQKEVDSIGDEAVCMWHRMYLSDASNKLDKPFSNEKQLEEMVDYFTHHGNESSKIKSLYLLACFYRQTGDSPKAITTYNRALSEADTLNDECDNACIMKIYGQMAMVYRAQFLPEEEIKAWERFSHFALKQGDTYNSIRGLEFMTSAYYTMGDTAKILSLTKKCHQLYLDNNMPEAAASVWPMLIYYYVKTGQTSSAHSLMDDFEMNSGLFDNNGNIVSDREDYYFTKGMYYLYLNELDSSEFFFRKLKKPQYDYYRYKGLMEVYQSRGITDSICLYSRLYTVGVERMLDEKSISAVKQTTSLYNYDKANREAEEKEKESVKYRWIAVVSSLALTILLLLLYMHQRKKKLMHQQEVDRLNSRLIHANADLEKAKSELLDMKVLYEKMKLASEQQLEILSMENNEYKSLLSAMTDADEEQESEVRNLNNIQEVQRKVVAYHKTILEKKEDEIVRIRQEIESIKQELRGVVANDEYMLLSKSDIVLSFRKMANKRSKNMLPSVSDWDNLLLVVSQYFPNLNSKLTENNTLKEIELYVCVLLFLDFSPGDMAYLLDRSSQRITNIQRDSNQKLFGESTSKTLKSNLNYIALNS